MNERARLARIALHWLIEPGNEAVYRMVNANGPVRALERLVEGDVSDAKLRGAVEARMAAGDPREVAEAAIARAERLGARIVIPEDKEWPQPVRDLAKLLGRPAERRVDREVAPPLCMWVRGAHRLDEALARSVAVVGARAATHYGEHVATTLAYQIAEREWTVVSGGAYGIDSAAHRGALNAGGLTVAVLACGIDKPYPAGNTALFDRIADTGLLISEWPPGSDPVRHRFLIRNRVIAAATRGTVVVEASARSGASQTLRRALALHRRPMVVPGPVTSAMSVGCHEMLREYPEIRLVASAAHVLEEIGKIGEDLAPRARGPERPHDALDAESAMVLEAVPRRGFASANDLAARAGLDIRTTMRRLTLLEDLGFLTRRGGSYTLALAPTPPAPSTARTTTHRGTAADPPAPAPPSPHPSSAAPASATSRSDAGPDAPGASPSEVDLTEAAGTPGLRAAGSAGDSADPLGGAHSLAIGAAPLESSSASPDAGLTASEATSPASEAASAVPEAISPAPQANTAMAEASSTALDTGTAAPEAKTSAPQASTTVAESTSVAPDANIAAPKANTALAEASTAVAEASSTALDTGTAAPEANSAPPEPGSTAPPASTTTPKASDAAAEAGSVSANPASAPPGWGSTSPERVGVPSEATHATPTAAPTARETPNAPTTTRTAGPSVPEDDPATPETTHGAEATPSAEQGVKPSEAVATPGSGTAKTTRSKTAGTRRPSRSRASKEVEAGAAP